MKIKLHYCDGVPPFPYIYIGDGVRSFLFWGLVTLKSLYSSCPRVCSLVLPSSNPTEDHVALEAGVKKNMPWAPRQNLVTLGLQVKSKKSWARCNRLRSGASD